ncbi:hypothetical protein UlMin_039006 [Ulmus minor]
MSKEEKRRKFNEAVLNTLYPPPPPPPPPQHKDEDLAINNLSENFDADVIPDDFGENSSSSDSDSGDGKLTRAQRKRLRKKKLKIDAFRRGPIVGPLLPSPDDNGGDGNGVLENGSPTVRRNAAEGYPTINDEPAEAPSCANKSKVKQRRIAKKLARKGLSEPSEEKGNQDQSVKSPNQEIGDRD